MRLRSSFTIFASLLGATAASTPLKLPLQWVKKQAYVVEASIDGQSTQLQLGTLTSDVWLACARFGSGTCTPGKCDVGITVENDNMCVTTLAGSTLSLGSGSESLAFPDVVLEVAQYHPLNETTSAPSVWTSNGQVYSSADYSSEQPQLASKEIQGVLGLGPNSQTSTNVNATGSNVTTTTVVGKANTFALYFVKESDGAGSFLQLGGSQSDGIDPHLLLENNFTDSCLLPLRRVKSDVITFESWDLSLVAVQFGQNAPVKPRTYSALENPGGDATAVLSLNHAMLMMPPDMKKTFEKAYLSSCDKGRAASIGQYYSCELSIMETLPRIGLNISDKVFYLDPVDYTHVSSTNESIRIVEIGSSGLDQTWFLGAPFLRKFPSSFTLLPPSIDLFCTANSSCIFQNGTCDRVVLPPASNDGTNSSGNSSTNSLLPWIGGVGGVAVVAIVAAVIFRRRRRTMLPPASEANAVANDKDAKEAKVDKL